MEPAPADVTFLLNKLAAGDQEAAAQLVPLVYQELRHLAARRLRQERPAQPTSVFHRCTVTRRELTRHLRGTLGSLRLVSSSTLQVVRALSLRVSRYVNAMDVTFV